MSARDPPRVHLGSPRSEQSQTICRKHPCVRVSPAPKRGAAGTDRIVRWPVGATTCPHNALPCEKHHVSAAPPKPQRGARRSALRAQARLWSVANLLCVGRPPSSPLLSARMVRGRRTVRGMPRQIYRKQALSNSRRAGRTGCAVEELGTLGTYCPACERAVGTSDGACMKPVLDSTGCTRPEFAERLTRLPGAPQVGALYTRWNGSGGGGKERGESSPFIRRGRAGRAP